MIDDGNVRAFESFFAACSLNAPLVFLSLSLSLARVIKIIHLVRDFSFDVMDPNEVIEVCAQIGIFMSVHS